MHFPSSRSRCLTRNPAITALLLLCVLVVSSHAQRMMPFSFWQSAASEAGRLPAVHLDAARDSATPRSVNSDFTRNSALFGVDVLGAKGAQPLLEVLQIYPNPFGASSPSGNPSTSMLVRLREDAVVTVRLYTMLSQPVSTLFDAEVLSGLQTLRISPPADLPSGTYFLGISSAGHAFLLRLVYLR